MKSTDYNHHMGFFKTKVKSALNRGISVLVKVEIQNLTELSDVMSVSTAFVLNWVGWS